jgi:hypothetical protein
MPTVSGVATTVPNSADLSSPSWTADGRGLIVSVGGSALARVDPTTGARAPIPGTTGASLVAVSRTGRMAFQLGGSGASGEVRVTGPSGGASTVLRVQYGASSLAWDPTGRWLAVTSFTYGQPSSTTTVYDTQSSTPLVRTLTGGGASAAWLDTASLPPSVTLTSPAWTTSSASLAVTASDPDDAVGGLRRECELDGGTWGPCSDTLTLTNLTAGTHTVQARATDPSGQQSPVASRSWQVDRTAPTAAIAPLPWVPLTTAPVLSWSGADTGGSGLSSFQIREREGTLNGPIGGYQYPSVWAALTGRSMTLRVAPGMQYCFSVRARDVAGNVGAWSAERCTSIAVDDRALTASSGWTRGLSSAALYGTWSRATRAGSTLSRPSVRGRRVAVIATTCSTCGAVDVYHAGVWLGRVSLSTPTTQYLQVRWLPLEPVTRLGDVVLKTVTAAPVYVDAIAAAH